MQKTISSILILILITACQSIGQGTKDTTDRSPGTFVDDKTAVLQINKELNKDGLKKGNHINVTVFNAIVLLSGEIANDSQKYKASEAAGRVQHIRKVVNQLAISAPSSFTSRLSDSSITGLVKTALFRHPDVRGSHIKVVTERGEVYLIGLVTGAEANEASNTARKVRGGT